MSNQIRRTEKKTAGPGGLATSVNAGDTSSAGANGIAELAEGSHAASGAGMAMFMTTLSVVTAC